MHHHKLQVFFYRLLFVLLFGSIALFVFYLLSIGSSNEVWHSYTRIYIIGVVVYTWFIFILLFLSDIKNVTYPSYEGEHISVLVPCFNEDHKLFLRSIQSLVRAKGNKDIIVIDDGSTNDIKPLLHRIAQEYNIKVHSFEKNKGKRHALHHAIKRLIGHTDFIVTIDSVQFWMKMLLLG